MTPAPPATKGGGKAVTLRFASKLEPELATPPVPLAMGMAQITV